jgi:plasmid stabilization system protein ParE
MRKLVWLDSAVDDVVRLRQFIIQENPDAAKRAAASIKEALQCLIEVPHIGKPVTDLTDYRDLLARFGAGGYVIRYRVYLDTIFIVHVRHYREIDFK